MNDDELAAISALAEAATPGPWAKRDSAAQSTSHVRSADGWVTQFASESDAEFIAAARSAVPALVAALAEARVGYVFCPAGQHSIQAGHNCLSCRLSERIAERDEARNALAEAHRTLADVEAVIVTELLSGPIGVADAEWGGKPVRLHPDEVREVAANVVAALAAGRSGAESAGEQR